ncbi:MAG TPA: helix-turn-helix domain-containing protein [Mycobacterium sp.]|nr:helix-turn-helix domain-containing protein [Mycobacterium sp.]
MKLSEVGSRSTAWPVSLQHATDVVNALTERADELADDLIKAIAGAPKLSDFVWIPAPIGPSVGSVRSVVAAMADPAMFDPQAAIQSGADQARQRVAVSSVIEGDHIGFRRLWQIFVDEAARHPAVDAQTLHQITTNLYAVEDLFETAKFTGYRDQHRRQMLEEMSQPSVMMDSLLHGQTRDAWTLWEVANYLRLPTEGPFVVIAAEILSMGFEALPEIESKLRSLDVFSAWRLLPDLQVGIVHVASDDHLDRIIALLTRMATDRVGVSARFDDLQDTPHALHFAKVSLRGRAGAGKKVAVFDGSMLATAAVSSPSVMMKSACAALDCFADLPHKEREMLFETFRVWLDTDTSVCATADVLFCHPNTVRKRLHRIEQRSGRSMSRPRDVLELCLALEVHSRLM